MGDPRDPPDLRAVKLVLTAACNLSCSYCYQNAKNDRRLAWDTAQHALDLLVASPRSHVELLFIGGEPLLEFPLIEQAVEYVRTHRRPHQSVQFEVITNGTLLGEREAAFFADHDFQMQLSFDGVASAQLLRGAHTFATLDRLLDRLRATEPGFFDERLSVNITLLPRTVATLAESVRYLIEEKGIQELFITPSLDASRDWRPERISELEAAFAEIYRMSRRRFRETGDVPLKILRRTGPPSRRRPEMSMCGVGRGDQIAVDVDGQAHGCLTFVESYQAFKLPFLRSRVEAMRLGDVRAPDLRARLASYPDTVRDAEIFHHKERKYSSYGQCVDCRYLAECDVCPMSIGRLPGHEDPRRIPDFHCAYNLVSLKYRHRFPRVRSLAERLTGPAWPFRAQPARRRSPARAHAGAE